MHAAGRQKTCSRLGVLMFLWVWFIFVYVFSAKNSIASRCFDVFCLFGVFSWPRKCGLCTQQGAKNLNRVYAFSRFGVTLCFLLAVEV